MELPSALFSPATLFTFGGAVTATTLLPNALSTLVDLPARTLRVIALIVALVISFIMAAMSKNPDAVTWLVAFFNGLLIYLSALGANETLARGLNKKPQPETSGEIAFAETPIGGGTEKRPFFTSWF